MNRRRQLFHGLVVAALLALVALLYWPTLDYPFIFDDLVQITDNPQVRIESLAPGELIDAAFRSRLRRPVAYLTYAVNYDFDGYRTRYYRLVNIVIHQLTAVMVYLFCLLTLGLVMPDASRSPWRGPPLLAALTALVWTVHPLHTQAVTYIVQRMTSMATLFYMAAFCCYIVGRQNWSNRRLRWLTMAAAGCCWLLAMGSKEIAVTWPVMLHLYEWYFFRKLRREWLLASVKYALLSLIVLAPAALFFLNMDPSERIFGMYNGRDFSMSERVMTEWRVVLYYLTLLIVPLRSRMTLDYDFPLSTGLFSPPSTMVCLLLILGSLGCSWWLAKRAPLLSFCILWYFINLALESSFIGLELVYEHRTYLPSIAFFLALVYAVHQYLRWPRAAQTALWLAVSVYFAVVTVQRNPDWRSVLALWSDCVAKAPNKARPSSNLGYALMSVGRFDEALPVLERAVRLDPDHHEARYQLGALLTQIGRGTEALPHLEHAAALKPNDPKTLNLLGFAHALVGELPPAIALFEKALRENPDYADAHNNLGIALRRQGDIDAAIEHYQAALRLGIDRPVEVNKNLGLAELARDRADVAEQYFRTALALAPDEASLHYNLGRALLARGDPSAARAAFERALQLKPGLAPAEKALASLAPTGGPASSAAHLATAREALKSKAYDQAEAAFRAALAGAADAGAIYQELGNLYYTTKRFDEALAAYRQAVAAGTADAGLHNVIGAILGQQGKLAEAVTHFREALRLDPTNDNARSNLEAALRMQQP